MKNSKTSVVLADASPVSDEIYSLKCNQVADQRLVNFHELEHHAGYTFRWSEPVAMIRLMLPGGNYRVQIETGCLRGTEVNFHFELHWNDYLIPGNQIRRFQGKIEFDIPASVSRRHDEQRLTLSCKPLRAENGRRLLGMPICEVRVVEVAAATQANATGFKTKTPKAGEQRNSKRPRWFGNRTPAPVIPIWNVCLPDVPVPAKEHSRQKHPACDRVIVAACEINSRHGTGLLIKYLIQDFDSVSTVSSMRCYNDDRVRSRVHHCLPNKKLSRAEIFDLVFEWFAEQPPLEAYVVPYFKTDMLMAIALRDLFQTKICLHIMDDNCLFGTEIPSELAAETIEKSDLVLAISPEMKQAYEQRFGRKVWLLPPIVPDELISKQLVPPITTIAVQPPTSWRDRIHSLVSRRKHPSNGVAFRAPDSTRGILIGNIWNRDWLQQLRVAIRESGLKVDWYTNNPDAVWLEDSIENLESDGIYPQEPLWGDDLVNELRRRPYAIMPTSELNGTDKKESIARLSLPSRVPFIVATSQTPIIAMGSEQTAAAKFIERFGVGTVIGYNGAELRDAARSMTTRDQQVAIRQRAFEVSPSFAADSVNQWLWDSLAQGQPTDQRFESLFPAQPGEFSCFFNPEPPKEIHWSFRETWQMLNRIRHQGFTPDTIIDVGASTGIWSWTASTIFPNAKYVLVDPMMSRYSQQERSFYSKSFQSVELVEAALSDHCGESEILVSNDLYGSSLLKIDEKTRTIEKSTVEVLTLDELARRRRLSGRTLLKVDVQFAEHLVVNGGLDFIRHNVDAIILELTIEREHPQAKTYREMLDLMDSIGFAVVDEMEGWRDPVTGRLEQKDSVFIRHESIAQRRAA